MNIKLDHLIGCLGEECGEVQQIVGKIIRFGILDSHPTRKGNNWTELRKEFHDIVAVWEMLCDEFDRVPDIDRSLIDKKKKRVEKYMQYAIKVGQLMKDQDFKGLPARKQASILLDGIAIECREDSSNGS